MRLTEEQQKLLEDLGYGLNLSSLNGDSAVVMPPYGNQFVEPAPELAFIEAVGLETARALDAITRLNGIDAGRRARHEVDKDLRNQGVDVYGSKLNDP